MNEKNVDEVYAYMKRKPRAEYVKEHLQLLEEEKRKYPTPAAQGFLDYLKKRLTEGKSVKGVY